MRSPVGDTHRGVLRAALTRRLPSATYRPSADSIFAAPRGWLRPCRLDGRFSGGRPGCPPEKPCSLHSVGLLGWKWLPAGYELDSSGMYQVLIAAVGVHEIHVACGGKVTGAQERDLGTVRRPRRTEVAGRVGREPGLVAAVGAHHVDVAAAGGKACVGDLGPVGAPVGHLVLGGGVGGELLGVAAARATGCGSWSARGSPRCSPAPSKPARWAGQTSPAGGWEILTARPPTRRGPVRGRRGRGPPDHRHRQGRARP